MFLSFFFPAVYNGIIRVAHALQSYYLIVYVLSRQCIGTPFILYDIRDQNFCL